MERNLLIILVVYLANVKYIVGSLPDISLDSMLSSAHTSFQEFIMDPSNSDRGQNPNSGIAAAGISAALGFTARQLAYV